MGKAHPFRMSLQADDGLFGMYHSLQHPVWRPLNGAETRYWRENRLMMGAVDGEFRTVKLRQKAVS